MSDEKKARPQDRWDAKAGLKAKTYKINAKTAEEFQATCKRKGVAMGTVITNLMREYIEQNKEQEEN